MYNESRKYFSTFEHFGKGVVGGGDEKATGPPWNSSQYYCSSLYLFSLNKQNKLINLSKVPEGWYFIKTILQGKNK